LGSRSAVFLPLKKPGLIIVDREEDLSYKEESAPRYHARQVAIMRANLEKFPVILASGAPSLESYYWAFKKQYEKLELDEETAPPGPR